MTIRYRERIRGLLIAGAVLGAAVAGTACGGDDSSSGGTAPTATPPPVTPPPVTPTQVPPPPPPPPTSNPPPPPPPPAPSAATPTFSPAPNPTGSPAYNTAQSVTIADSTPGATIFFTTDGTNPTAASTVYANPIPVSADKIIRAFAKAPGFSDSAIAVGEYKITIPTGSTEAPSPTPDPGALANATAVALSTSTSNATICYTVDGVTAPACNAGSCTTGQQYNAASPISIDAPAGGGAVKIKATACKAGNTDPAGGAVMPDATYTFKAANPTVAPIGADGTTVPASYKEQVTLSTLTGGGGVDIHFRVDGTAPNCLTAGAQGPGSFPTAFTNASAGEYDCAGNACLVTIGENISIKAVACKTNYTPSNGVTFGYTVQLPQPTLTNTGSHANDTTAAAAVGAGGPAGSHFCWTTGAAAPACGAGATCGAGSTTAAPTVTTDGTTVNVRSCLDNFVASEPTSAVYGLQVGPVLVHRKVGDGVDPPAPYDPATSGNTWDPASPGAATFTLSDATNNTGAATVKIRYTTNDVAPAPDCGAGTCTGANSCTEITNPADTAAIPAPPGDGSYKTLRAIACKTGYSPSAPRTISYKDPTLSVTLDPIVSPATSDNKIPLAFATTPAIADGTQVCFNQGLAPATPDCDPAGNPANLCTNGTLFNAAAPQTVDTTGFTVRAIACKSGVPGKSNPQSKLFTLKVGAPFATDSAAAGGNAIGASLDWGSTFYLHSSTTLPISKTCTAGTICFRSTKDGTVPTCSTGDQYDPATGILFEPSTLASSYKIIACEGDDAFLPSDVKTVALNATLKEPTIAPSSGTFTDVTTAIVSSISAAYLCVSTGAEPQCIGGGGCTTGPTTKFTSPHTVNIATSGTSVKAIACRDGFNQSAINTSGTFTLNVAPVTITPATGSYTTAQTVLIKNGATPNADVCYSTNGADVVDCSAPGIPGPAKSCAIGLAAGATGGTLVGVTANTTVKAIACRSGFNQTAQAVSVLTFTPYSHTITIDGTDDWLPAEQAIATESGQRFTLSWDGASIYVGFLGSELENATNRYFHVYVRGATGPYTATSDSVIGVPDDAPDFASLGGANFHFYSRTNRLLDGVSKWNGAAWTDISGTVTWNCKFGGALGTATAFTECSMLRSDLGLAGAGATLSLTGGIDRDSGHTDSFPWSGARRYWQGNLDTSIPTDSALLKP
jgi:hypothetical protein